MQITQLFRASFFAEDGLASHRGMGDPRNTAGNGAVCLLPWSCVSGPDWGDLTAWVRRWVPCFLAESRRARLHWALCELYTGSRNQLQVQGSVGVLMASEVWSCLSLHCFFSVPLCFPQVSFQSFIFRNDCEQAPDIMLGERREPLGPF